MSVVACHIDEEWAAVPAKAQNEQEVISGLRELIGECVDPRGLTAQVNEEHNGIWEESAGYDPETPGRIKELDSKIANIRKAVEDGMPDSDWTFSRMRELVAERDQLVDQPAVTGTAPQIDVETAMSYRMNLDRVHAHGDNAEPKTLVGGWVEEIELAPETLEVEITYRIPELVMHDMGAGTRYQWFSELVPLAAAEKQWLYLDAKRGGAPLR